MIFALVFCLFAILPSEIYFASLDENVSDNSRFTKENLDDISNEIFINEILKPMNKLLKTTLNTNATNKEILDEIESSLLHDLLPDENELHVIGVERHYEHRFLPTFECNRI